MMHCGGIGCALSSDRFRMDEPRHNRRPTGDRRRMDRAASAATTPVPAAEAAARTAEAPDAEGWRRLVIPIESIDHAGHELIELGAEAEVLAPAPLRARIGETACRLAAFYANGAAASGKEPAQG